MKLIPNLLAGLILTLLTAYSQESLRDIGVIRRTNWLGWDQPESNIIAFRVFVGETNFQSWMTNVALPATNFTNIAMVTDRKWAGAAATNLNGWKAVYVTAVEGNLPGGVTIESDRSEVVKVFFRGGVPVPPNNVRLFEVMQYLATNQLALVQSPPAPDPAALPAPSSSLRETIQNAERAIEDARLRLNTLRTQQEILKQELTP